MPGSTTRTGPAGTPGRAAPGPEGTRAAGPAARRPGACLTAARYTGSGCPGAGGNPRSGPRRAPPGCVPDCGAVRRRVPGASRVMARPPSSSRPSGEGPGRRPWRACGSVAVGPSAAGRPSPGGRRRGGEPSPGLVTVRLGDCDRSCVPVTVGAAGHGFFCGLVTERRCAPARPAGREPAVLVARHGGTSVPGSGAGYPAGWSSGTSAATGPDVSSAPAPPGGGRPSCRSGKPIPRAYPSAGLA